MSTIIRIDEYYSNQTLTKTEFLNFDELSQVGLILYLEKYQLLLKRDFLQRIGRNDRDKFPCYKHIHYQYYEKR